MTGGVVAGVVGVAGVAGVTGLSEPGYNGGDARGGGGAGGDAAPNQGPEKLLPHGAEPEEPKQADGKRPRGAQ